MEAPVSLMGAGYTREGEKNEVCMVRAAFEGLMQYLEVMMVAG